MRKHICDFCKVESNTVSAKYGYLPGWRIFSGTIGHNMRLAWDICPDCGLRLGIEDDSPDAESNLLEALRDMISEAVEEARSD